MGVERGQKQYKGRSPKAPARHNTSVLLLLALEAGYEHLLGLLGGCQIALEHGAEEVRQFLIAKATALSIPAFSVPREKSAVPGTSVALKAPAASTTRSPINHGFPTHVRSSRMPMEVNNPARTGGR